MRRLGSLPSCGPNKRPGPGEVVPIIDCVLQREFGFEILPPLNLWNEHPADALLSAGTGTTLKAEWSAEWRSLEEQLEAIGDEQRA